MGCNRVLERIAAATGNLKAAPTIFQTVKDVPNAGVLCALPSLLENGIIYRKTFGFPFFSIRSK